MRCRHGRTTSYRCCNGKMPRMVEIAAIVEVGRTLKNIALGASPWVPGQRHYGIGGFTADELTAALASDIPGARIESVDVIAGDAMTTDHAHLVLTWNADGRGAVAHRTVHKGTPAGVSTRISTRHSACARTRSASTTSCIRPSPTSLSPRTVPGCAAADDSQ